MIDLDARLLAAHQSEDTHALVALYVEAADQGADEDAYGFYLVHAYVFALETNHPLKERIRARLSSMGREQ